MIFAFFPRKTWTKEHVDTTHRLRMVFPLWFLEIGVGASQMHESRRLLRATKTTVKKKSKSLTYWVERTSVAKDNSRVSRACYVQREIVLSAVKTIEDAVVELCKDRVKDSK